MKNFGLIILALVLFFVLLSGCSNSVQNNFPNASGAQNSLPNSSGTQNLPPADNSSSTLIVLSMSEVAKHNTESDCWFVINGKVYNMSSYVEHPGGSLAAYCGKDATNGFNSMGNKGKPHSQFAESLLNSFLLGSLNESIDKAKINA